MWGGQGRGRCTRLGGEAQRSDPGGLAGVALRLELPGAALPAGPSQYKY